MNAYQPATALFVLSNGIWTLYDWNWITCKCKRCGQSLQKLPKRPAPRHTSRTEEMP